METSPGVEESENQALLYTVTDEEIRLAVFQAPGNRAPGPDGL